MKGCLNVILITSVLFLVAILLLNPGQSFAAEHRAFWVDAWGSGFENPTATTAMINYVDACNCNVVLVEVRKRADAYYTSSYEPIGWSITPQAGYDPLADIVTKGHDAGLEVHAWVVVNRAWTSTTPPPSTTPQHIFNAHPEWFSLTDSGSMFQEDGCSWTDPGHPEVENHYSNVFREIVQNYNIDGLCLDYIRYAGTNWGYNPTAVARYNAEYGLQGNPSPNDTQWSNWRRDQVTNVVKRTYLEAKAIRPSIKVGAAVWSTAYTANTYYFQNWDLWMSSHFLDYAAPMNYLTDNNQFNSENQDNITRQYGRHVYIAQGSYLNTISNSMTQISSVQSMGFPGVQCYCYRVTNSGTVDREGFKNALLSGPFSTYQSVPTMSWISSPTKGMLKGFVKNSSGVPVYPATVTVLGANVSTKNSGAGFYGFVDLNPGTYTVVASSPGYTNGQGQVTITAGQVSTLDLTLGVDSAPPIISNVRTNDVRATIAQILWDTDEASTSQVEYGPTSTYGYQTTENMTLVTSHTVQLTGLTPSTTYHYRVKSKDGANNQAVSGDYTFVTAASEVVDDIIVDNPACELYGSWYTGTSATDKYGSDYYYCSTATSETRWAKWTPNVLVRGTYNTYVWYSQGTNRSAMAPYTVYYYGGSQSVSVNQQTNGGTWNLISSNKRFDPGTAQYVKLGNGTGESSQVVIADAVKFVYTGAIDIQPPSAPTNLNAVSASTSQINLSWTASTDDVGVTGYKIYRNGSYLTSVTGTSYSNTGLSAGTSYTYYVKAYDAAGNESAASNSDTATTWIILDNPSATYTGTWTTGTSSTDKYGTDYRFASTASSETATAKWTPTINSAGSYNVYVWYPQGSNRSTKAPYTVYYSGGNVTIQVNQTTNGGKWNLITTKSFATGTTGYVKLGNGTGESSKVVMADAVRWTKVE
ncbi:MAG: family 10 glycosylhydrolase [Armatimonadetes bacterium]|nr:family 10 glycosylhydrolase [Armatimonadota bacterium]